MWKMQVSPTHDLDWRTHPSCYPRWLLKAHSCTLLQRALLRKTQPGDGTLPAPPQDGPRIAND